MNIKLHIERLILDGLPVTPAQGAIVRDAVESELTRLLASEERLLDVRASTAMERVKGESVRVTNHDSPAGLGQQIARSVRASIAQNLSAAVLGQTNSPKTTPALGAFSNSNHSKL